VEWAYRLTKDMNLGDTEPMQKRRALSTGFPKAQRPPGVMKGGSVILIFSGGV
jgi:purine nucleoside permease